MHLNRNPAWKTFFPQYVLFFTQYCVFLHLDADHQTPRYSFHYILNKRLVWDTMTKSETDCITALSPRCLHRLPDHYQYRDRRWSSDRRIKKVRRGKQNHKEKTSKPFREADKNNKGTWNRNSIIKAHLPERGKSFLEPLICSPVYYMINTIISDVFMVTAVILN